MTLQGFGVEFDRGDEPGIAGRPRYPVRRHEHDFRGEKRRGARIEGGEADLGSRVLAYVIHVLGADARLDHELLARRHDVEDRLARADDFSGRRDAQRHYLAIDRRAHHLALDLVLRGAQALLELAHPGRGFPQLVGGLALVLVARLRDARVQLPDALARRGEVAAGLADAAAVVGGGALEREHARAVDEALSCELVVDLQFLDRELRRGLAGRDLAFERRGLGVRVADLRLERGDLLVEGAPARSEECALARRVLGGRFFLRRRKARRERGFGGGASLADELGAQLVALEAERRIAAHVAHDDERLASADFLAVAHQDLAHDAAFLVLHRLAVELDLHLRRCDDRPGERRGRRPQRQQQYGRSERNGKRAHTRA